MIFIFGTGTSHLVTAPLAGVACTHCGNTNTLSASVFSRYFSLFWIPAFPLGKRSVTVCEHCKQTLTGSELPATYQVPVRALQEQARTPLTNFALLLVLAAGILFVVVVGGLSDKSKAPAEAGASAPTELSSAASEEEDNESNKLLGKRYKIALAENGQVYSLAKVTRVTADSVQFRLTRALRGELSDASAALALRDSVDPTGLKQGMTKTQWQTSTSGQGAFQSFE